MLKIPGFTADETVNPGIFISKKSEKAMQPPPVFFFVPNRFLR